jgi:5-methylcytosine-specific restriction enzyme A
MGRLHWTRRWRKKARRQLSAEPLCRACFARGVIEPACEADHVRPHRGDPQLFWHGALQSLCHRCHAAKSAAEEGFRRRGFDKAVGVDGFPLDPRHPCYGTR